MDRIALENAYTLLYGHINELENDIYHLEIGYNINVLIIMEHMEQCLEFALKALLYAHGYSFQEDIEDSNILGSLYEEGQYLLENHNLEPLSEEILENLELLQDMRINYNYSPNNLEEETGLKIFAIAQSVAAWCEILQEELSQEYDLYAYR